MNGKIIDLHKILYPDEYVTPYIFTYSTFNDELKTIIEKSGYKKEFKTKYHKCLRFLEQLKHLCTMQPKVFERLVDGYGLYSMILKGDKNIRILFDFQVFNGRETAVLYNCFQEKNTKDYSYAITTARDRRAELFNRKEETLWQIIKH